MKFKNELERRAFQIAEKVCGPNSEVVHNTTIRIERADCPEVASFVGPPKKEIDVITAGFEANPDVKLLISCKEYGQAKAEPADVQEWAAVVRTMNHYAAGTRYLGLIVCPSGFTSGCEPWATSYNLGVIPPLKGKRLKFGPDTCDQMLERVLLALKNRLHFPHADLFKAPQFSEFVYRLTEAFEGRDRSLQEFGSRYILLRIGWASSFQELIKTFRGKVLQAIQATSIGVELTFVESLVFRMIGDQVQFGSTDAKIGGTSSTIRCEKNFIGEVCSLEFLKGLVVGQSVTSAGDWGNRFEFGLTDDLMLAIEPSRLQVYRTRNPIEEHLL